MGLFSKNVKTSDDGKINLMKEEVHKICLTKKPLTNLRARVGLVIDCSGSMHTLYKNGTVQNVIDKILPLAMEFDDNMTMEAWMFNGKSRRLSDITLENYDGFVKKHMLSHVGDGTKYAPVINDVIKEYGKSKIPAYVIFITDGDTFDKDDTDKAIIEASRLPIFWQFVGIGHETFGYLQHLDDMQGRYVDNADFFKVDTMDDITYEKLLNEFPQWLENDKVKTMM